MNSYSKTNRDYREAYLKESKDTTTTTFTSSYPNNISLRDFFMYLLHPVFVY